MAQSGSSLTIILRGVVMLASVLASAHAVGYTTEFQYDSVGNLRYLSTPNGSTYYDFDVLDRLTSESGPAGTQQFTYDGNGNRLTDGGGTLTYPGAPTPSNRINTRNGAQYGYDGSLGNIADDGTYLYIYNKRGQIAQVKLKQGGAVIATYSYDYRNRRTKKVAGGQTTIYHYDQWDHLIGETTSTGIAQKTYAYRDHVPVAQIEHGSPVKITYLFTDHLGTPRTGRDNQGQIVWSWNSNAFGSTAANSDPDGNSVLTTVNLRFPGQYFDQESGHFYNNQRYYDPRLGRYLQGDPIGLAGGINTYAYADNNPASYTDPLGLTPASAAIAISIRVIGGRAASAAASRAIQRSVGKRAGRIIACAAFFECSMSADDDDEDDDITASDEPPVCPVTPDPENEKRARQKGDRFTSRDNPVDHLEEIEKKQRDYRQGKSKKPVDSIGKSEQRAKDFLKNIDPNSLDEFF